VNAKITVPASAGGLILGTASTSSTFLYITYYVPRFSTNVLKALIQSISYMSRAFLSSSLVNYFFHLLIEGYHLKKLLYGIEGTNSMNGCHTAFI
jgi:hypothetical protein